MTLTVTVGEREVVDDSVHAGERRALTTRHRGARGAEVFFAGRAEDAAASVASRRSPEHRPASDDAKQSG